MFSCFTSSWKPALDLPEIPDFRAAGTLFTNGSHVLAAYQKDSSNPTVSGIGGKREGSETYMETAMRETVEELFGVDKVSYGLICKLAIRLQPLHVQKINSYVLVVYNFNELEKIIEIVRREIKTSPVYLVFPKTVSDLVLNRVYEVEPAPEIMHLAILPIVKNSIMDTEFVEDIRIVLKSDILFRKTTPLT